MSPGITPRPSLNGAELAQIEGDLSGVAGDNPPALIERCTTSSDGRVIPLVSPGITPRPSLNVGEDHLDLDDLAGVAGDNPPALIERGWRRTLTLTGHWRVAGDNPPALIERRA